MTYCSVATAVGKIPATGIGQTILRRFVVRGVDCQSITSCHVKFCPHKSTNVNSFFLVLLVPTEDGGRDLGLSLSLFFSNIEKLHERLALSILPIDLSILPISLSLSLASQRNELKSHSHSFIIHHVESLLEPSSVLFVVIDSGSIQESPLLGHCQATMWLCGRCRQHLDHQLFHNNK